MKSAEAVILSLVRDHRQLELTPPTTYLSTELDLYALVIRFQTWNTNEQVSTVHRLAGLCFPGDDGQRVRSSYLPVRHKHR